MGEGTFCVTWLQKLNILDFFTMNKTDESPLALLPGTPSCHDIWNQLMSAKISKGVTSKIQAGRDLTCKALLPWKQFILLHGQL